MTRLLRSSDKIDITQYLPPFLKKDPHFRAVCEACSWEHENIRNVILDALNQFFVEKATWGLSRWEELLGIEVKAESTEVERRAEIIRRLQKPKSVTKEFLEKLINMYIADESGKVTADTSDYSVEIRFNAVSHEALSKIIHGVKTYIPAHLGLKGKIDYKHERTLYVGMKRKTSRVINVYPMDSQKEVFDKSLYLGIAMEVVEDLEIR